METIIEKIHEEFKRSADSSLKKSKKFLKDFVIYNNENDIEASFLNLIPQVFNIHNNIIDNK